MRLSWTAAALTLALASTSGAWERPVAKDASLISQSLCCGSGVADQNFGFQATVDAGRYHHQARALLGFDLSGITANDRVWLVLPGQTVGAGLPDFTLSLVQGDWNEATVTYNTAPDSEPLSLPASWVDNHLRFDVTDQVHAALQSQLVQLSFIVDAQGSTNLFIPSRENASGLRPAWLDVTTGQTPSDEG
ncbi:DNRLRE domain-containing protein [Oligoflexus tunisiensis]|uniref:DNRLRE domain-containing protein n=1 Tax=Oligoflexus tunisiensis TaxID=708132 RepID=UPI00114C9841|nr:DNRLRE domain-containing protein [Oligoflexus tunisiensis]